VDGRGANATFLFSGVTIGKNSSDTPTHTSTNVIITHMAFQGAGHVEDHDLNPDMIHSTGNSSDIWIHKNTFRNTGDSAFDVRTEAHHITISFNRVVDVKRATLHGADDGDQTAADEKIRTTIHHNAFITTNDFYDTADAARRVPLIRWGKSHLWNNIFFGYHKDFASVRVGAELLLDDNVFLGGTKVQEEKSTLEAAFEEWVEWLSGSVLEDGGFTIDESYAYFSDDNCVIDTNYQSLMVGGNGGAGDLAQDYSERSRQAISAEGMAADQDLVSYVNLTAGKGGEEPFQSLYYLGRDAVLGLPQLSCTR
jgi:pectate lyase